jgi:hypothetical protein
MDFKLAALFGSYCFIAACAPLFGTTWTPDSSVGNVGQHQRLYEIARDYGDENFDPEVNLMGVDTAHPPDKTRHSFRESTYYAYGLLMTGDPAYRVRAQEMLKRVLASQDMRPGSPSNGAFLWYTDQHWETLQNPDLNSAPFVGLGLADIIELDRKHPCLDPNLRDQIEKAGRLAVQEIMRRDVDPGYTNIALISIAVAAAGQKLWAVPGAGEWAQAKLDAVLNLAGDGYVYEYLSPTYTAVDFIGAYMAKKFAFSDAFARKTDAMIDSLWKQVAAAYHAPTFQLGGPFGRAYGDDMLTYAAGLKYWFYLGLDGAYPINETDRGVDKCGLFLIADLPISARPEFKTPPPSWQEFTAVGPDDNVHPVRHLFQYRDDDFILGTVAFQDEWKQKRNLVAYWRSNDPSPAGFRVGFCIDKSNETLPNGFPYAQILFYSQQVKRTALVVLVVSKNIPKEGGCSLVFDHGAMVVSGKDSVPLCVTDGSITTYLWPVSTGTPSFIPQTDAHNLRINRPWTSADAVGPLHVLSYLVVFRRANEPAPTVSDIVLKPDTNGGSASAKVDGSSLSVSFKI